MVGRECCSLVEMCLPGPDKPDIADVLLIAVDRDGTGVRHVRAEMESEIGVRK